jgi:hypothetical protein
VDQVPFGEQVRSLHSPFFIGWFATQKALASKGEAMFIDEANLIPKDQLDELIAYLESKSVPYIVNINVTVPDGEVAVGPAPVPVPQPTIALATVTEDKAVLRCMVDYNKAGYPIMSIYEGPKGRVRFDKGQSFKVYPKLMKGDGGGMFYMVFDAESKYEAELYARADDVSIG